MSHMVIYRGIDGKPGYHQTDDIHDAIGFVEQMRNEEGVEHARIFRLEEVVFEYRPYYRVELAGAGDAPAALNGAPHATLSEMSEAGPDMAPSIAPPVPAAHEGESIDLPDDVIDVIDSFDETEIDAEGGIEAGVGGGLGKKGLFGR